MSKKEEGVWRTIMGRKVFIPKGSSVNEAIKKSGKFKKLSNSQKSKLKAKVNKNKVKENNERVLDAADFIYGKFSNTNKNSILTKSEVSKYLKGLDAAKTAYEQLGNSKGIKEVEKDASNTDIKRSEAYNNLRHHYSTIKEEVEK